MARTRINEPGFRRFSDTVAHRFIRVGEVLAESMRAKAPVRRGHRSYDTTPGPLGGTLRDSIAWAVVTQHGAVAAEASPGGQLLDASVTAEAAAACPRDGVVVVVGTATAAAVGGEGYGLWVNSGTSRMEPRPFAEEAFDEVSPQVPQLVQGR